MKATPLVVNGVMYVSTGPRPDRRDRSGDGQDVWLYNPEAYAQGAQADTVGVADAWCRVLDRRPDDERILMGTFDGYLLALDAKTGKPIASFGETGKADLLAALPRATRGRVAPVRRRAQLRLG